MKDIEHWLKEQALPEPSPALDARVERLFRQHSQPGRLASRPIPLWLSAAACLVCFAGGVLASFGLHYGSVSPPTAAGASAAPSLPATTARGNLFDWSAPAAESTAAWAHGSTVIMEMNPGAALPARVEHANIIVEQLES